MSLMVSFFASSLCHVPTTYKAYKGKKHGKNHYNIYETRHVNVLSCLSKNHSSPFNQNVYVRLCEEKEAFNFSSNALQF